MLDRPLSELLRGRKAPLTLLRPARPRAKPVLRMRELRREDAAAGGRRFPGRCSASLPGATRCAACWRRAGTPTSPPAGGR